MLSKSTWSLLVSVAFALAQPFIPVPDSWKPILGLISISFLILTIIGWLCAHSNTIQTFRHGTKGSSMLTISIVGLVGAGIAIGLWWLLIGRPSSLEEQ